MNRKGIVYLVGAGPGDPKLITVKGLEVLREADVIVYDRLVDDALLHEARKDAERIYVGKWRNCRSISQDDINHMLVAQAGRGKIVVRLKGGDPGIFGRVGEEAEYCQDHQIPFEIVPGITSGLAAPVYAGIPLTHRDISSSVAIVTGHRRKDGNGEELRWEQLALGVDTIVFYMGIHNLPLIRQKLLAHGKSAQTPVALIRWGTYDHQETLVGCLEDIAEKASAADFRSPAIIVVGEVVRLREKLAWFEQVTGDIQGRIPSQVF